MVEGWYNLSLVDVFNDRPLWTLNGIFSEDTMTGLIAGALIWLAQRGDAHTYKLRTQDYGGITYEIREFDDFYSLAYLLILPESQLRKYPGLPPKGLIEIWVRISKTNEDIYMLIYSDHPKEFFQGFISMANAFQIDFRDYLFRLPVDSEDNEYDLPEYELKEYFGL